MKIMAIVLAILGLFGGMAAGHFLAPKTIPEEMSEADAAPLPKNDKAMKEDHAKPHKPKYDGPSEYAKLDKHFVVPVIEQAEVTALVVVTMAIEVNEGSTDLVYLHEPKLRDEFLSVLFNFGRTGAFDGAFTEERTLNELRASLNAASQMVIGKDSREVLLTSIIRQDM